MAVRAKRVAVAAIAAFAIFAVFWNARSESGNPPVLTPDPGGFTVATLNLAMKKDALTILRDLASAPDIRDAGVLLFQEAVHSSAASHAPRLDLRAGTHRPRGLRSQDRLFRPSRRCRRLLLCVLGVSAVQPLAIDLHQQRPGGGTMLHYALVFLVLAIIAAIFGFGMAASAFAGIAKILFFLFIVAFVVSLIFGRRGAGPVV